MNENIQYCMADNEMMNEDVRINFKVNKDGKVGPSLTEGQHTLNVLKVKSERPD